MSWVHLSDSTWRDVELANLPAAAFALHIRALTWTADQLTDGVIPEEAIKLFNTRKRCIDELLEAGVWRRTSGGYLAVKWQTSVKSRGEVLAYREQQKQRVRVHRNAGSNAGSNAAPDPDPVPDLKKRDLKEAAPPLSYPDHSRPKSAAAAAILKLWHEASCTTGTPSKLDDFVQACTAQATIEGRTPEQVAKRAIEAFRSDEWVLKNRGGFGLLVAQRDRWVAPPLRAGSDDAPKLEMYRAWKGYDEPKRVEPDPEADELALLARERAARERPCVDRNAMPTSLGAVALRSVPR